MTQCLWGIKVSCLSISRQASCKPPGPLVFLPQAGRSSPGPRGPKSLRRQPHPVQPSSTAVSSPHRTEDRRLHSRLSPLLVGSFPGETLCPPASSTRSSVRVKLGHCTHSPKRTSLSFGSASLFPAKATHGLHSALGGPRSGLCSCVRVRGGQGPQSSASSPGNSARSAPEGQASLSRFPGRGRSQGPIKEQGTGGR